MPRRKDDPNGDINRTLVCRRRNASNGGNLHLPKMQTTDRAVDFDKHKKEAC